LLWNHQNSCGVALACMWHNQLVHYSMRMQLNFNYVVSMLGITEQVLFLPFVFVPGVPGVESYSYKFNDTGTLVQAGGRWPRFGSLTRDELW
jgi:hypothetical protein